MLSAHEAFQFDLQGYLVLRGALDRAHVLEIAAKVAALDDTPGEDLPWSIPVWTPVVNEYRVLNILDPVPDALAFVDIEPVHDRLCALMDPGFRMTEAYSITRGRGIGLNLHHIPDPMSRYRLVDGQPRATYLKVSIPLADCKSNDGPFCVIEGSHKPGAPFPYSTHDPRWGMDVKDRNIMEMMVGHEKGRPTCEWNEIPGFKELETEVGDVVIFTESLIHGARQNLNDGRRRGLFFGYGLGACANWHGVRYSPELLERASERQRELLGGPQVGFRYETAPPRFALPDSPLYPFQPTSEHPALM